MSADYDATLVAVLQASHTLDEFTTDDVWPLLDFVPAERNVVGKAFAEAARRGWIVGTERFVRSTRPEAKGRRVQVWQPATVTTEALF